MDKNIPRNQLQASSGPWFPQAEVRHWLAQPPDPVPPVECGTDAPGSYEHYQVDQETKDRKADVPELFSTRHEDPFLMVGMLLGRS